MKVFLTGGTGFVGRHVLEKLLDAGHDVRLLVRPGSKDDVPKKLLKQCELVKGDILQRKTILKACKGVDAVINLVGILREFPRRGVTFERLHVEATFNCVLAAQEQGVDKFVQMSALGARQEAGASEYHSTKYRAEMLVKNSGLNYTIFRPSTMFGEGPDAFQMLSGIIEDHKLFPLIGGGRQKWQPAFVGDVADAFVKSLDFKKARNAVIECGGPKVYELREIVDLLADSMDKKVWKFPMPLWVVKIPTWFLQYQKWYPLGMEMLEMLGEDNVVSGKNFDKVLGLELASFEDYLKK